MRYGSFQTHRSGKKIGNSLSDELELSSVLSDTRAHLYSPVGGSYSEPKGNSS